MLFLSTPISESATVRRVATMVFVTPLVSAIVKMDGLEVTALARYAVLERITTWLKRYTTVLGSLLVLVVQLKVHF